MSLKGSSWIGFWLFLTVLVVCVFHDPQGSAVLWKSIQPAIYDGVALIFGVFVIFLVLG